MNTIHIEIHGLDKLQTALPRLSPQIKRYMAQAGDEAAKRVILLPHGSGRGFYPSETDANRPPPPFYIRGRGMQYATYNTYDSKDLGARFQVESRGWNTVIGNNASYAPRVIGEKQAPLFRRIGWVGLLDSATRQINKIQKVYQAWVEKAIRDLDL